MEEPGALNIVDARAPIREWWMVAHERNCEVEEMVGVME
jgi:hypothetical protein